MKGNIDLIEESGNEIGLVLVNEEGEEVAGFFFEASAEADDSKIYLLLPVLDEDGTFVREDGRIVTYYTYTDFDILEAISDYLPIHYPEYQDGRLLFLHEYYGPIEIVGLDVLLEAFGIQEPSIMVFLVNWLVDAYCDCESGTCYVDINLAELLAKAKGIIHELIFPQADEIYEQFNVDVYNLDGLFGHVTIGGTIEECEIEDGLVPKLTGCEFSVNIPKCTFYLNGERDNFKEIKIEIPAISFAVFIDDYSFITTDQVADVIPDEARAATEYFNMPECEILPIISELLWLLCFR